MTPRSTDYPAETIEAARRLYVDKGLAPAQVAEQLGGRFTAKKLRSLAHRQGWSKARPAELKLQLKRQQLARAAEAAIAGRRRAAAAKREQQVALGLAPRPIAAPAPLLEGRRLAPEIRAAIDAAVAAGKVTVLPAMRAAGLGLVEQQFWAASAALGGSWREQKRRARGGA